MTKVWLPGKCQIRPIKEKPWHEDSTRSLGRPFLLGAVAFQQGTLLSWAALKKNTDGLGEGGWWYQWIYYDDILGKPMGTPKTPHDLSNNHAALLVRVWCTSFDILYNFIAFDPRTKRLVQDLQTKVGKLISPTMTVQTAMNRWILQCNHQLWRVFFRFFYRNFLFLEIQGLWFQPFNLQGCTDKPYMFDAIWSPSWPLLQYAWMIY